MGRIVAIGGGELDTTHVINKYIVEMTEKKNPNMLFVGTASHDAEGYISAIKNEFEGLGCTVNALRLITEKYTDEAIDNIMNQADIIYVGGGDTSFMMEIWKKHRIDIRLKQIYRNKQTVLAGLSAGAICWFSLGHSDSSCFEKDGHVGYGWVNGLLELHSYAFCPHYNERREIVDRMISDAPIPCIALDNNVAFVEQDGNVTFITSDISAKAYVLKNGDDSLNKQEQKVTVL